jgi:hypothetical protein
VVDFSDFDESRRMHSMTSRWPSRKADIASNCGSNRLETRGPDDLSNRAIEVS